MNYVAIDKKHVWHPFTQELTAPDPILIKGAKGSILYKENGEEVLDLVSSWWVNIHGHANEKIVQALHKQAQTMEHVIFAGFTHKPAIELSQRLTKILPDKLERVFFSDNGSTAVEIALKLSLQYWFNKGQSNRKRIIAFNNSYHGDTFGAMSVAKESGFYEPFEDKLFHVDFINYPSTYMNDPNLEQTEEECLKEFTNLLDKTAQDTSAIILEPLIQGAGGMNMMTTNYLQKMVKIAKSYGILVIFDEVMVGFGRTGDIFACNKAKVEPDLICLSKGLTGGFLPMAITVATEEIYEAFLDEDFNRAFAHGHSFTANPLGCAVALASLDITLSDETQANLKRIEKLHRDRLEEASTLKNVEKVRLCGTVGALDVISTEQSGYTSPIGTKLKTYYWKHNIHLRPLGNVVYMLPPYCTTNDQLNKGWDVLLAGIKQL